MKVSEIGLFIFLGLMTAVAPLATDMYLPALPELAESFGISPSLAQLTLTMTMAGMALGQLLAVPFRPFWTKDSHSCGHDCFYSDFLRRQ